MMEMWFVITVVTACLAILLNFVLTSSIFSNSKPKWPPGPGGVPIFNSIQWIRRPQTKAEAALRFLRTRFGSIVALRTIPHPLICIFSHSLAHEALVKKGAVFADRPKIITNNHHNITSARYGPHWRLLRRNLTSRLLHPSRIKDYSHARRWVLHILLTRLRDQVSATGGIVEVMEHFRFVMFSLLVYMCFGDKLDEPQIRDMEAVQHRLVASSPRYQILNLWPRLTQILFHGRWKELHSLRTKQEKLFIPLIQARASKVTAATVGNHENQNGDQHQDSDQKSSALRGGSPWVTSYVDTLLKLEIEDEYDGGNKKTKRKLTEKDMVSACSEFLTGGTDTTSTTLQWIMANLVKYPHIQAKLFQEIEQVVMIGWVNNQHQQQQAYIGEDELSKMSYLKAVVLEGLRRHPPTHFVVPHAVTQEVELGGYTIPENAIVNFMVAEMGWNAEVWENPMEFKPERFLHDGVDVVPHQEFDITGSREIKMMPFGVGRRMCPAYGLAMLHLEYFVANLVWNFEWAAVDEVDLSEKQELSIVMKHPLKARISQRL